MHKAVANETRDRKTCRVYPQKPKGKMARLPRQPSAWLSAWMLPRHIFVWAWLSCQRTQCEGITSGAMMLEISSWHGCGILALLLSALRQNNAVFALEAGRYLYSITAPLLQALAPAVAVPTLPTLPLGE